MKGVCVSECRAANVMQRPYVGDGFAGENTAICGATEWGIGLCNYYMKLACFRGVAGEVLDKQ